MKKRFLMLLASAALTFTMLSGCGGAADESANEASKTEGENLKESEKDKEDKKDESLESDMSNTLIYAGESEDTINPLLNNHDELPSIIFSGLTKYDVNGKPICDLAESYEYDEKAMAYTFKLKEGIKWHDGEDFSVQDIVYTYELLTKDENLTSSIKCNYEDIESIEADEEKNTVTFKMARYNAGMLDNFSIGILPKHILEGKDIETDPFNQSPVGTGRYKFVSWDTAGGNIILERNEDYYDKVPNIERLIYKTVAVESTKATMLKTGEADLAWLNSKYAKTFREDDGYTNYDFKTADYRAISCDFKTEFWQKNKDSIAVLNYAIDKDAIVKSVLAGDGFPAYSPMQINEFGGNKKADIYPYDLDRFAEEMDDLGWKKNDEGIYERDGEKFEFTIQVRDYEEERVDIVNVVSKQLEKVGVKLDIVLVTKFDWNAGYNGFVSGYAIPFDPDGAYAIFAENGSQNSMKYDNLEVTEDLIAGRHQKDIDKRKEDYHKFEYDYALNPGQILIVYLDGNYVGVKGVEGLDTKRVLGHHAVGVMWNIEDWTISR